MAERRFEVEVVVDAPLEAVRAAIPDAPSIIELNPLVASYRLVKTEGKTEHYEILDRVRVLGFAMPVRYAAAITPVEGGFDSSTASPGRLTTTNQLRFGASARGTWVRELVVMRGPPLVVGFAAKTAERAHETMLRTLRERVERTARGERIAS
ncbi:MAG: hypothetical protein U0271_42230 [Polyangiaceae bacterium]